MESPSNTISAQPAKGKGKNIPPPLAVVGKGGKTKGTIAVHSQSRIETKHNASGKGAVNSIANVVLKPSGPIRERRKRLVMEHGEDVEYYWVEVDRAGNIIRELGKSTSGGYEPHKKTMLAFRNGEWQSEAIGRTAHKAFAGNEAGKKLRLVTYNTWFGPTSAEEAAFRFGVGHALVQPSTEEGCQGTQGILFESLKSRQRRHARLVEILEQESPDIVALQEVRHPLLEILKATPFVQENYNLAFAQRGGTFEYGLAFLAHNEVVGVVSGCAYVYDFTGFTTHSRMAMLIELVLPSSYQPSASSCVADKGDEQRQHRIILATTHLDSETQTANRVNQLQFLTEMVLEKASCSPDNSANAGGIANTSDGFDCVICGDMNFAPGSAEQEWFDKEHSNWVDVWTVSDSKDSKDQETGSNLDGTTVLGDDARGPERIDRVFTYGNNKKLRFASIRKLGEDGDFPEGLSSDSPNCIRPSDHCGLLVDFDVV